MTLLPVEPVRISYDPSWEDQYPVERSEVCQAPGCNAPSEEGHHIVRRSYTGNEPRALIAIDGVVVQNVIRLCRWHHHQLTGGVGGHQAKLSFDREAGWLWHKRVKLEDEHGHRYSTFQKGEAVCPVGA
jgi:hypothetical protein